MRMAEHREPYDLRESRTVLGARGGEIPPRDSPNGRPDRRETDVPVARRRPRGRGPRHAGSASARYEGGTPADAQAAALRLMRKLLKKQGFAPKLLVTDKLGSYGSAFRQLA